MYIRTDSTITLSLRVIDSLYVNLLSTGSERIIWWWGLGLGEKNGSCNHDKRITNLFFISWMRILLKFAILTIFIISIQIISINSYNLKFHSIASVRVAPIINNQHNYHSISISMTSRRLDSSFIPDSNAESELDVNVPLLPSNASNAAINKIDNLTDTIQQFPFFWRLVVLGTIRTL